MTSPIAALAVLLYAAAVILGVIVVHRLDVTIRRASRPRHAARGWWSTRPRAIDDAYTVWLDAHSRCDHALRAWNAAGPAGRGAAYRTYLAELEREEEAARQLERLQPVASG